MSPVVLQIRKLQASSHSIVGKECYLLTREFNFNDTFKTLSVSQVEHARAGQGAVAV